MSIPTWDDVAADEFWERVPTDLHEDSVRGYLGTNGDAIDARVSELDAMASDLNAKNFFGPSIVTSVIGLEVMIQYFCIRPIVQGIFLSDLIALEVAQRIFKGRSSDQRSLLSALLKPWGIELSAILLPSKEPLWSKVQSNVIPKRDAFVHQGDDVSEADAVLAIECVRTFRKEVVLRNAARLKFTLGKTGCWSEVIDDPIPPGYLGGGTRYTRGDPFS